MHMNPELQKWIKNQIDFPVGGNPYDGDMLKLAESILNRKIENEEEFILGMRLAAVLHDIKDIEIIKHSEPDDRIKELQKWDGSEDGARDIIEKFKKDPKLMEAALKQTIRAAAQNPDQMAFFSLLGDKLNKLYNDLGISQDKFPKAVSIGYQLVKEAYKKATEKGSEYYNKTYEEVANIIVDKVIKELL